MTATDQQREKIKKLDQTAEVVEIVLAEHRPVNGIRDGRKHCSCGWAGSSPRGNGGDRSGERSTHIAVKVAMALDLHGFLS